MTTPHPQEPSVALVEKISRCIIDAAYPIVNSNEVARGVVLSEGEFLARARRFIRDAESGIPAGEYEETVALALLAKTYKDHLSRSVATKYSAVLSKATTTSPGLTRWATLLRSLARVDYNHLAAYGGMPPNAHITLVGDTFVNGLINLLVPETVKVTLIGKSGGIALAAFDDDEVQAVYGAFLKYPTTQERYRAMAKALSDTRREIRLAFYDDNIVYGETINSFYVFWCSRESKNDITRILKKDHPTLTLPLLKEIHEEAVRLHLASCVDPDIFPTIIIEDLPRLPLKPWFTNR